jgi:hypothetical protein
MKTSNKDARKLVNGLTEFKGSNTFAEIDAPTETRPTWLYVVYSYGYHFPMYIAEWLKDEDSSRATWYENIDKYSQSTTRQQSQLRPSSPTIKMDTETMRTLARYGIVGVVVQPQNNRYDYDTKQYTLTPEQINETIAKINSKLTNRLNAW